PCPGMIVGSFDPATGRPEVDVVFTFPNFPDVSFGTKLLIDTGATRTTIAPLGARQLQIKGLSYLDLPSAGFVQGVGGASPARQIAATLMIGTVTRAVRLTVTDWVTPPN